MRPDPNTVPPTQRREGSSLVLVLGFVLILTLLAGAILRAAISHRLLAAAQVRLEQALFAAEAGVAEAAQVLLEEKGFLDAPAVHGAGTTGNAAFTYRIQELPGWKQYSIHATGTVGGVSRRVDIGNAYFPTFATFAMWSRANGVIYYIPGEIFSGRIHSDDRLWFSSSEALGGPVFSNKVTSASEEYGGNITYVDFQQGFERGVSNGSLAEVDFPWMKSRAQTVGLVLNGQTGIRLDGDKVRVTNQRQGWVDHEVTLQPNQLIYVADATDGDTATSAGTVDLQGGTLAGRLTITAEDDILIHDHLRYHMDPRADDPENGIVSTDSLGLISRDDVWVSQSAPNNLELFAAVLATGARPDDHGSFGVLDYNVGSPRGDLMLYGSLVQETRGAVGTFGADGPRTGYRKNYHFDPRFERSAPPYYPELSNRIALEGWSDGPVTD